MILNVKCNNAEQVVTHDEHLKNLPFKGAYLHRENIQPYENEQFVMGYNI